MAFRASINAADRSYANEYELSHNAELEIHMLSRDRCRSIRVGSRIFWPHKIAILPWCSLVINKDQSLLTNHYFQFHEANTTETISDISSQYIRAAPNLIGLFIMMETSQLKEQKRPNPAENVPFLVVVVRKHHKIIDLVCETEGESKLQATVSTPQIEINVLLPQPSSELNSLMKEVQHVIQNKKCISLDYISSEKDQSKKRILPFFMIIINRLQIDETMQLTSWSVKCKIVVWLLLQDIFFYDSFPKDFIFYFNLANLYYSHESLPVYNSPILTDLITRCMAYLLIIPSYQVLEHLTCFINMGDNDFLSITMFEYSAKSFLSVYDVYVSVNQTMSSLLHVLLLIVSLAVKLLHACKSGKPKELWETKLNEYYKSSGFSFADIVELSEGFESMALLLADCPELIVGWKEFCTIFTCKIHLFAILREFINVSVKYLIKDDDHSFCVDFLQPVTSFYLNASKKKTASHFAVVVQDFIKDGKKVIDCLLEILPFNNNENTLKDWLKILFNLIDICNPVNREELVEMIPSFEESCYEESFINELEKKLEKHYKKLPPDAMIKLTSTIKSTYFNKSKVVVDYLSKNGIPAPFRDVFVIAISCDSLIFESARHDYDVQVKMRDKEAKVVDALRHNRDSLQKEVDELRRRVTEQQEEAERLSTTLQNKDDNLSQSQESHQQLEKKVQELLNDLQSALNWNIDHKEVTITKQELGRGGWGVIWIGEFRGQTVAVKQMYDTIASPRNMELLQREVNIMAQLRHPNLLQFIGAVFDHPSGNPLIITEVMDTSLRKAYEETQLTPDQQPVILSIMRDVAVGLNYLHTRRDPIIHRDVSSANVLLESKGPGKWKTKISDFGSANIARLAITRGAGAAVYCAPECNQGIMNIDIKEQTPQIDVYSYGILLCEVLTCQFPERSTWRTMLDQVKTIEKTTGSLQFPFFKPPLYSLIVSCVHDKPHQRPTMEKVIDNLSSVMKK